jgi:YVTN family beta-propeller protein
MNMLSRVFRITAVTAALVTAASAQGRFTKVTEIQIGGAAAFDYLNVDSGAKRLYVTHGTEIVVIDTAANAIVGRIADTPRVHGIAIAPELGKAFTTNGGENKVSVVDLKTLQTTAKIDTGANPDAVLYEPATKALYTFNGAQNGGFNATVIDAAKGVVVATVDLGDKPEAGQDDPAAGRVFVNLENKNLVAVIDAASNKKIAEWPLAPVTAPTGMAIDRSAKRLFVGGGGFLAMIDYTSGKVVASVPICQGTDATWYDQREKLIFNSCGDGHITVSHMDRPDKLAVLETVETTRGARTMAFDPATNRIYTAAPKYAPADPTVANARPTAIPDSFHVLVLEMKR